MKTFGKVFKKILTVLSTILLIALVLVVIFIFVQRVSGETPSILGYRIYRVSSGSMEPQLMVGDVIIVKEVLPETLENGDIITYNGTEGSFAGLVITHQIVEDPVEINDVYYFQTQGTAEGSILDPQITEEQVIGKYIFTVPLLNYLFNFFMTPWGLLVFILILVLTFGSELIRLVLLVREKENEKTGEYSDENSILEISKNAQENETDSHDGDKT